MIRNRSPSAGSRARCASSHRSKRDTVSRRFRRRAAASETDGVGELDADGECGEFWVLDVLTGCRGAAEFGVRVDAMGAFANRSSRRRSMCAASPSPPAPTARPPRSRSGSGSGVHMCVCQAVSDSVRCCACWMRSRATCARLGCPVGYANNLGSLSHNIHMMARNEGDGSGLARAGKLQSGKLM